MNFEAKAAYGIRPIYPELACIIIPPPPQTLLERACEVLRRSLFIGLIGIIGAGAITVAPAQAVSAFVIAFAIGMARGIGQ